MGDELVRLCDGLERHGLVNYQIGVWEEEIISSESNQVPEEVFPCWELQLTAQPYLSNALILRKAIVKKC